MVVPNLFLITHVAGMGLAFTIPLLVKSHHIKRQNALLHRARAHLLLASQYLDNGNRDDANMKLAQIERLEALWRYGNSRLYRFALATVAISAGFIVGAGTRAIGILAANDEGMELSSPTVIFISIQAIVPAFAAISSWRESWKPAELLDNCGVRLKALLSASREVVILSVPERTSKERFSGQLSPQELLGLQERFSKRELDTARRRLATLVHPDLGPSHERQYRERSMRRVNAAYDALLPMAIR